jgi:hypothetical protein
MKIGAQVNTTTSDREHGSNLPNVCLLVFRSRIFRQGYYRFFPLLVTLLRNSVILLFMKSTSGAFAVEAAKCP